MMWRKKRMSGGGLGEGMEVKIRQMLPLRLVPLGEEEGRFEDKSVD